MVLILVAHLGDKYTKHTNAHTHKQIVQFTLPKLGVRVLCVCMCVCLFLEAPAQFECLEGSWTFGARQNSVIQLESRGMRLINGVGLIACMVLDLNSNATYYYLW